MGIPAHAIIRATWEQRPDLGPGGRYALYGNAGQGAIDYDRPLADLAVDAWPDMAGLDGYGWGEGSWGSGGWGTGGLDISLDAECPDGLNRLAVVPTDAAGNPPDDPPDEAAILVRGTPRPPAGLGSPALADGVLTMTFRLSRDDDAA